MISHTMLHPQAFSVLENRPLATRQYVLRLRPVDEKGVFSFLAGQWCHLHLFDPDPSASSGQRPWRKAAFSIASAPQESPQDLELAIKIEGELTTRGAALRPGDMVGIQGPFGRFTVPKSNQSLVFLAGGIGVVPFRSMIRQLGFEQDSRSQVLIHSNRDVAGAPYLEDLQSFAKQSDRFQYIPLITGVSDPSWMGERGRMDVDRLGSWVPDLSQSEIFICGSNGFIDGLKGALLAVGIPTAQIHVERFS